VTGNRFGRAREQHRQKQPPQVAKFNDQGSDSPGVEWQRYGSSSQTTRSLAYRCDALGGAD